MSSQEILTELLLDESFSAWVLSGGKESGPYWEAWVRNHPEQEELLYEARAIRLELQRKRVQMPASRKKELRQRIIRMIRSDQRSLDNLVRPVKKGQRRRWPGIAAAVLVLFVGSVLYRFSGNQTQEMRFATTYGEIKVVTLPDSSRVTLNGNSSIRYSYEEQEAAPREVWLEGEAFFEVRKHETPVKKGHSQAVRFIVHTQNLSVQVLGTRFNVRQRRDQTQVVLEEGQVQLTLEQREGAWLMAPDQLVEVNKGEQQIVPQPVKARDYTAWKEGLIHFEGASYSEISRLLADDYGLDLHFKDNKRTETINLRGSFPAHNIDVLLEAIANVTHTTLRKEGKTVVYQ